MNATVPRTLIAAHRHLSIQQRRMAGGRRHRAPSTFNCTVADQLELLNRHRPHREATDYWPKSPRALGDALRRYSPALTQFGIKVEVESRPRARGCVDCDIGRLRAEAFFIPPSREATSTTSTVPGLPLMPLTPIPGIPPRKGLMPARNHHQHRRGGRAMNATPPRTLINLARADGVQIVVEDGRVKLRGDPNTVAHWAAELRPYKSQIIEAAQGANDAHRLLLGVIVSADDPFDLEQFGIKCLSYLHTHGLLLALEAGQIVVHGTASPQIVEEAAALVELHRDDLLAALRAELSARSVIERAAQAE